MSKRQIGRIVMLSCIPLLGLAELAINNDYHFLVIPIMLVLFIGVIYLAAVKYNAEPYAKDDGAIFLMLFLAYILFF